jgi:hypothetical protein
MQYDVNVKEKEKEEENPNAYLKWDANQKELVPVEIPETAIKVPSVNSDINCPAGTYVVEGEVTIGGEITLTGDVNLIIKDGAKLTVNQIYGGSSKYNLSIYGQANQTGQLVVNNSTGDAISMITTLEVHSCQVTATSSANNSGGFYNITTFNVYGGSVDAENTGSTNGYGIKLANNGSMNIYGGDVKAVGKGGDTDYSYGITGSSSTVTVYGGKLWAENADYKALNTTNITLTKDASYTSGTIRYSSNKTFWSGTADPDAKYVKVEKSQGEGS